MQLLLSLAGIWLVSEAQAGVLQDGIIGGKEADPHSRPYMAYLMYRGQVWNSNSICGGFLVREDFIMTAAHCNGSYMNITLGAHNIKVKEKSQQMVHVLKHFPHPRYDPKSFANDIMLLKLKSKVKLNRYVKTIPLPWKSRKVKVGDVCSVAGWGQSNRPFKPYPPNLQEVDLKVVAVAECKKISKAIVESSVICAGDPREEKASFKGDSGGPLVCQKVVQGIVSCGLGNGSPPRIFTRISAFKSWIKQVMSQSD